MGFLFGPQRPPTYYNPYHHPYYSPGYPTPYELPYDGMGAHQYTNVPYTHPHPPPYSFPYHQNDPWSNLPFNEPNLYHYPAYPDYRATSQPHSPYISAPFIYEEQEDTIHSNH